MQHYSCMVDLLGRSGCLNEACDFINKMPIEPDAAVWGSLLSACRVHTNIELGELAAKRLFELVPKDAAPYVLLSLSNIYSAAGRWDGIEKIRKLMEDRGITKKPGWSWIVVAKQVHAFVVGDRSNPNKGIFGVLKVSSGQKKASRYASIPRYDAEERARSWSPPWETGNCVSTY